MDKFENLIPYRKAEKWGYADKNRNLQVPCAFDFACPFEAGLAAVEFNHLWGAVNLKGQLIIPCVYQHIVVFSEGMAAGTRDGKLFEVISDDGTRQSNSIFDYCGPFQNGRAIVSFNERYGVINKDIEAVIEPEFEQLMPFGIEAYRFKQNGMWGLLNLSGDVLLAAEYYDISDLDDGKAVIQKTVIELEPHVVFDENGEADDVEEWEVDIQRFGVINGSGQFLIPCEKYFVRPYHEGVAVLGDGYEDYMEFSLIDDSGKDILGFNTSDIRDHSGFGTIVLKNDKWGVVTKDGKWIIEAKYEVLNKCANNFYVGAYLSEEDTLITWHYIDEEGAVITTLLNYEQVCEFSEGLAAVCKHKKYGYVNLSGEPVIPPQYEIAKPFIGGMARVKKGKWGFINTAGEVVADFKYDVLGDFQDGFAEVRDWSESDYKTYYKSDFQHPGFWNLSEFDEETEGEEVPWLPLKGYINQNGDEFFEGYFPHTSLSS